MLFSRLYLLVVIYGPYCIRFNFQLLQSPRVSSNQAATFGLGAIQVIVTVIATLLMERAGRRLLLLISASTMTVSSFVVAAAFFLKDSTPEHLHFQFGIMSVTGLLIFVIGFAIGLGGVPWIIMSELRGRRESQAINRGGDDILSGRQYCTGDYQGLHHLREQLRHLERHHAAVAKPNHRALLHPELPQPLCQTLRLKSRRPVRAVRDGAAEEEEVRHVDGILLQPPDLELPRQNPFSGEAVHQHHHGFGRFGVDDDDAGVGGRGGGGFVALFGGFDGVDGNPEVHYGSWLDLDGMSYGSEI
nr:sugar transporter ERD6-like 6 [Ipomoea batatas]